MPKKSPPTDVAAAMLAAEDSGYVGYVWTKRGWVEIERGVSYMECVIKVVLSGACAGRHWTVTMVGETPNW